MSLKMNLLKIIKASFFLSFYAKCINADGSWNQVHHNSNVLFFYHFFPLYFIFFLSIDSPALPMYQDSSEFLFVSCADVTQGVPVFKSKCVVESSLCQPHWLAL